MFRSIRVISVRSFQFRWFSNAGIKVDRSVAPQAQVKTTTIKMTAPMDSCGTVEEDDELEELEDMFIPGPAGIEWNGPTRGGKRPEPTRYGDWERKGRASDF